MRIPQSVVHLAAALCLAPACGAATPGEVEFFESRIRPVLAQDCYECHRTGGKTKGGLALDHRAGLLKGGERGPAIVPGDPARSVLMAAIRHTGEELQMPRKGAKLEAEVIADFEKWIAMGAPDPRDAPPAEAEVAADTDWSAVMRRRKSWWSFQPVKSPAVPEAGDSPHPVDRFVAAALEGAGLRPAGPADRRTLIRRLSFALRGLPPSPGEVREFCDDQRPDAYERLVDRYLASPQFGERWARHWMDWLRYADSHGSEGDPMIANAWRYRDYLIRALNAGVPYDQLVREHLAGDLLEDPRVADGINESMLGTAHLRMVFHGFAPTDALDEQVRFTDDQINVLTKGFLGLTVSCARCHDHKFDAISQADYYALYGILASTKPGVVDAQAVPATQAGHAEEMARVKTEMRRGLAAAWTVRAGELGARLAAPGKDLAVAVEAAKEPSDLLHLLRAAGKGRGLSKAVGAWRGQREALRAHRTRSYAARWNLGRQGDLEAWRSYGRSTGRAAGPGEITIAPEGGKIIAGLYPSGTYSHLISTKDRGVLLSPQFELDGKYRLFARVAGDGEALVRYSVQNYPRKGTVFPITPLKDGKWRWVNYGLDYWEGDRIHLEATTAADQPVEVKNNVERSWYGVQEVVIVKDGEEAPPAGARAFVEPILDALGEAAEVTREDVLRAYGQAAAEATRRWRDGTMSDAEAELLAALLEAGLLPNTVEEVPAVASLLEDYRRLEGEIAIPIRAPGVWEAPDPADQPLFVRGDHKQPAGKVPRRFLEAIDPEPYRTPGSGRRELAGDFLRPDNPFTSRVIVNRVWHHLFGRGLVATADNFGRLGEKPTHPELLDHLAAGMRRGGWSLKGLVRDLVLSETWKRSSDPPAGAAEADPGNLLLSHFRVRRLEAEAIRDSLLAVAGALDERMFGPPVTGGSPRRSVYMRIKRNNLDPFLAAFDAPVPASTMGRRNVTNVPAQSLALLNSEFVLGLADRFASRTDGGDDGARVAGMFEASLGRPPTAGEREAALEFVARMAEQRSGAGGRRERTAGELREVSEKLAGLVKTVRERVVAGRDGAPAAGPSPIAHWDFEGGPEDRIGGLHAELHGGARIVNGALVTGAKKGYASTGPLRGDLRARTLEAWVQLDNLAQKGGGVVAVQTMDGHVFDAIVFGETEPRRWLAGSDHHKRTKSFAGPAEGAAGKAPVHVAITWDKDGTITCYRDGKIYGTSYKSKGAVTFKGREAQVLFGNRHGEPAAGRLLAGRIFDARLYDRALSAGEIAASAGGSANFVLEKDLLAAMTDEERAARVALTAEADRLRESLETLPGTSRPAHEWADLAHALFNLKEFIYVR